MRGNFRTMITGLLAAATLAALPVSATAQDRPPTPEEKAVLVRADEAIKRKDYVTLRAILAEPAVANYAPTHRIMAQLHQQGLGGPKDLAAARARQRRAAELGDVQVMMALAKELELEAAPASRAEAKRWFTASMASGLPHIVDRARAHLGRMLWNDGDAAGAVNQWSRGIANPFARACLGSAYVSGKGVQADPLLANYQFHRIAGKDLNEGVTCTEAAANTGNAYAQYAFALVFDDKQTKSYKPARAVEWLRKAADGGHPRANLVLAERLDKGAGVPRDAAGAFRYYTRASASPALSKSQREIAFARMGELALVGDGTPKNVAQAVQLLSKSEYGNHNYQLGLIYAGAEGWPRDLKKAVDAMRRVSKEKEPQAKAWLKQLADAGNAHAQHAYAAVTRYDPAPSKDAAGRELSDEQKQAIETTSSNLAYDYDRRAAQQNLPDAMYSVATNERQLPDAERLRLMRGAAERDHIDAMVGIGRWQFNGWYGLAKDPAMARIWLDRAAAIGNPRALSEAGQSYETQAYNAFKGIITNPAKLPEVQQYLRTAARYYEMAHAAGSDSAAGSLAYIYSISNIPGIYNPQLAFKWRKINVAKNPDRKAMIDLYKLYETGLGTAVDPMRAWFWAQAASLQESSWSDTPGGPLYARLTPAQRVQAERAVMTCVLTDYQTCTI